MNTTTSPSAGRMMAAIGLLAIGGIFAGASGAELRTCTKNPLSLRERGWG